MDSTRLSGGAAEPELPELDSGVRLLDVGDDATGPLHALVLDHLLSNDGPAWWVDAGGHAVAHSLASLAPSTRTLDRIQVARGFTAHQHARLVDRLADRVGPDASLLVCPAFDRLYRDAETYADEGEALLLRSLAAVVGLADRRDVPVLVTRSASDAFADPLAAAADETIRYERTELGPRFVGDDFETLVYPTGDGAVQTTLAFWQRVLSARRPARGPTEPAATPREVTADGSH